MAAAKNYTQAVASWDSQFVSMILNCEVKENEKCFTVTERGISVNTKLTNSSILHTIQKKENIYYFSEKNELEIDITAKSVNETAQSIFYFISESWLFLQKACIELMKWWGEYWSSKNCELQIIQTSQKFSSSETCSGCDSYCQLENVWPSVPFSMCWLLLWSWCTHSKVCLQP